jgi:hypothetical protein
MSFFMSRFTRFPLFWRCVMSVRKSVCVAAALAILGALPAIANAEFLVSAEFQGAAGTGIARTPNNQSGDEAVALVADAAFHSAGKTWNHLEIAQYDAGAITNPSFSNLVDRETGAATGVGFSITGATLAYNNEASFTPQATDAARDFFLFNIGALGLSSTANWQISGLTPGTTYKLYLYGGGAPATGRGINQTVDVNGNGSLADDTAVLVGNAPNTGALFSVVANGNGMVLGSLTGVGTNEGDWSGFQITDKVVREPGTSVLVLTSVFGLAAYAWRKRR